MPGQTATSLTLRRQRDETDTVLRGDIEGLTSTGKSLMPEGLEKTVSKQEMADLLAFLREELEKYGISAKPGDRVVITKFEVKPDRILFEFNDGPEKHHHILQHVEVGGMGGMAPLAQDDGHVPIGARMQLVFTIVLTRFSSSARSGSARPCGPWRSPSATGCPWSS